MISVHAEACRHLHRSVQQIKALGVKAGVALNPATPLETIDGILEDLDFVLIMSVNPGFGGQSFITSVLSKVQRLRQMANERKPELAIEIDGGVKLSNVAQIREAGVDWFVAGSAIFKTDDYTNTIGQFKQLVGVSDGA